MPTTLIIDDEPEANRLLARLIQIRGYQADSVYSGSEALSYLQDHQPDVIFLDLMLPDINGYDICRAIKSRPETSLIPVVIITARLAAENRTRSYQLGANGYVSKPYTPDQIFVALASAAAWRSEVDRSDGRGAFPLGENDDQLDRELARLHSLIIARTPLNDTAVAQMLAVLRSIGQDARDWGVRNRVNRVATASYDLLSDRIVVRISDEAGWFQGGDLTEAAAGFEPPLNGVFDEIGLSPNGKETVLTRLISAADVS